jgi:hypothetical protein
MEQEPNQEKIEKQKIIEMIKAKGSDDPETRELYVKWYEGRLDEINKSEDPNHGNFLLQIEISDMYLEANEPEIAFRNLEDILHQADQENNIELQEKVVKKLKSMRIKYPELVKKLATFPLLSDSEVTARVEKEKKE